MNPAFREAMDYKAWTGEDVTRWVAPDLVDKALRKLNEMIDDEGLPMKDRRWAIKEAARIAD